VKNPRDFRGRVLLIWNGDGIFPGGGWVSARWIQKKNREIFSGWGQDQKKGAGGNTVKKAGIWGGGGGGNFTGLRGGGPRERAVPEIQEHSKGSIVTRQKNKNPTSHSFFFFFFPRLQEQKTPGGQTGFSGAPGGRGGGAGGASGGGRKELPWKKTPLGGPRFRGVGMGEEKNVKPPRAAGDFENRAWGPRGGLGTSVGPNHTRRR